MKIAIVLPRHNRFSPDTATSIDLCVHDFVFHSRHREKTTVYCPLIDNPFHDVHISMFRQQSESHSARAKKIAQNIMHGSDMPDVVIVHQHLPTASALVKYLPKKLPVLFHTHNFAKQPKGFFSRMKREKQYNRLAGLIFVSKACRSRFHQDWPLVTVPTYVVHNGLDFAAWTPVSEREKVILYAGRMAAEKGVRELVDALPKVLKEFVHWKAVFLCTEGKHASGYSTDIRLRLAALEDRVILLEDQSHTVVQHWYERAAIAVVPSQFDEPFGRTAIEAFAGGSALVTSGTGGLKEVVGDCAVTVSPCTANTLVPALKELMQKETLRKELSKKGLQRGARHFSVQQSAATLDDLYEKTVQQLD